MQWSCCQYKITLVQRTKMTSTKASWSIVTFAMWPEGMKESKYDVRVLEQTTTLTFHCECTEARWVNWNCSGPAAAAGVDVQPGRSAPLSSPPALARGHGPIAIVGWLHPSKPRSRVQPPPLFAPPLSVVDVPPSPNLTVTQRFSVHIVREGPVVSVDTPSPSIFFASGLALPARLTCAVAISALPRLNWPRARGHPDPASCLIHSRTRRRSRIQNERQSG